MGVAAGRAGGIGAYAFLLSLLMVLVAGPAAALEPVFSRGWALMGWDQVSLSRNDLNWVGPDGSDTRNTLSGSWVQSDGKVTHVGDSDYFEGGWVPTRFRAELPDAVGAADTSTNGVVNRLLAFSDVSPDRMETAKVFVSQAVLTGTFTVPVGQDGPLTITVPYRLAQALSGNGLLDLGYNDVSVSLTLYVLDQFGNIVASPNDTKFLPAKAKGRRSSSITREGTLTLTLNLVGGIAYDLEVQASTTASAFDSPLPYIGRR